MQGSLGGQTVKLEFVGQDSRWLVAQTFVAGKGTTDSPTRIIDLTSGRTVRTLDSSVCALHPKKDVIVIANGKEAAAIHLITGREEVEA